MTEHSIEVLTAPMPGSDDSGIAHRAFCQCNWSGDWWIDISHAIYGQAVLHLQSVGHYDRGDCGEAGLGCPILQIDGEEVQELECGFCGSVWNWGPLGWTQAKEGKV